MNPLKILGRFKILCELLQRDKLNNATTYIMLKE